MYFITLHFWFVKYSQFTEMILNVQLHDQRVNSAQPHGHVWGVDKIAKCRH